MGKLSRQKGAEWEREVARRLRPMWKQARRGLSQPRLGCEVADVEGTPYWWECKVGAAPPLLPALRQAERDEIAFRVRLAELSDIPGMAPNPAPRMPPIAAVKMDSRRPIAVLYLDDLIAIMRLAKKAQEPKKSPEPLPQPSPSENSLPVNPAR